MNLGIVLTWNGVYKENGRNYKMNWLLGLIIILQWIFIFDCIYHVRQLELGKVAGFDKNEN